MTAAGKSNECVSWGCDVIAMAVLPSLQAEAVEGMFQESS